MKRKKTRPLIPLQLNPTVNLLKSNSSILSSSVIAICMLEGYVGIHSSGFRDFLLKSELLRAIVDSGFEHPSEGNLLAFSYL
ncbi:hypothetical protein RIF29_27176 [Crotalaria pallida]|uniref:Uncharacterized protein n=1 Tax=Crotalaria pallida TaxID=3830 RepID=A0AAN9EP46_CROPI